MSSSLVLGAQKLLESAGPLLWDGSKMFLNDGIHLTLNSSGIRLRFCMILAVYLLWWAMGFTGIYAGSSFTFFQNRFLGEVLSSQN